MVRRGRKQVEEVVYERLHSFPRYKPLFYVKEKKDLAILLSLGYIPWINHLINKWALTLDATKFSESINNIAEYLKETTDKKIPRKEQKKHKKIRQIFSLYNGEISIELLTQKNMVENLGARTNILKSLNGFFTCLGVREGCNWWAIPIDYEHFKETTTYFIDRDLYVYYINTAYFQNCWKKYQAKIVESFLKHQAIAKTYKLTEDQERIVKHLLLLSPSAFKFAFTEPKYGNHYVSTFMHLSGMFIPEEYNDQRNEYKDSLDSFFLGVLKTDPPKEYTFHIMLLLFYFIIDLHNHSFIEQLLGVENEKQEIHSEDVLNFIHDFHLNPDIKWIDGYERAKENVLKQIKEERKNYGGS